MKFKILFTVFLLYILLFNQVLAGIIFSEIFPNTENDATLEYIELYNSGFLDKSLSGYTLKDKSNKEYIFQSGSILKSLEKKQYFRSETKILLNNSNEEIFLYSNSGQLLDNFKYETTIKGEKIGIINTDTGILLEEGIKTLTGITNTNTGEILEEVTEISTGIINTNTGEILEKIDIFNLNYSFQNPSYLVNKDIFSEKYICDNSKIECKINLDLRKSFTGTIKEKDYLCIIDFGFEGWLNGEENKCNPSTVTYPKGTYDLNFKIISKSDSNLFYTGSFILENNIEKEIVEVEKIVYKTEIKYRDKIVYKEKYENNLVEKPQSKTLLRGEGIEQIIIGDDLKIIIQSGLDADNLCKKEDCKINLKYEENNKLERCEWSFDGGKFKGTTNLKCNPGYVSYGLGDYKIKLKVYEKGNIANYKESFLYIKNIKLKQEINQKQSITYNYKEEKSEKEKPDDIIGIFNEIILLDNNNELQKSKLEDNSIIENLKLNENNSELIQNNSKIKELNKKREEKIDKYKQKVKKEFIQKISRLKSGIKIYGKTIPNAKILIEIQEKKELGFFNSFIKNASANYFYETNSDKKGDYKILIIEFIAGEFIIKNNIIDKLGINIEIEKEKKLNLKKEYIQEMEEYIYKKFMKKRDKYSDEVNIKSESDKLIPVIEIQGKIGKNKSLNGNIITCYDTCSINFDARNSIGNIDKYIWDFGNGKISDLKNPGYVKYKNKGAYKISLTIFGKDGLNSTKYFYVIFTDKPKTIKNKIANMKAVKIEKIIEKEGIIELKDESTNTFLYVLYALIFIFGIVLVFLLLKKDDLI